MGFKAPTAKAADYICVNSRCLYPQQVLRFTVIWELAEVLGCRPGLRRFLQGFMGVAVVPVKPVSFERRRKSRSCPMEVEHRESPEPKYIGGYYSHEPLQKQNKNVKRGYCNET